MAKKQGEWFRDADFWEQYAPVIFDEAHWAEVQGVADGLIRLADFDLYSEANPSQSRRGFGNQSNVIPYSSRSGASNGPRVLDLCCGFGRISAELARRGCAVTGVDITKSYLETAKEEAALDNLDIEYIHADAREWARPDYFDLAVNLYISFGYFDDEKEDRTVLRNVYNSLKSGCSFIIETLGKEIAVRDFLESEWFERAGWTVLTKYKAVDSWTRLSNRWILINGNKRLEKEFTQRLYAASELRELMSETGFTKVEIFGDWDERPYDQNAQKLIVVGRKK